MRKHLLSLVLLLVLGVLAVRAQPPPRVRKVIRDFLIAQGYPNGLPGHVVDHKYPLCAGGIDGPRNLQLQERALSKQKDVDEYSLCADIRAFLRKWNVTMVTR